MMAPTTLKALQNELHQLADKLVTDGWDRLRGARLAHVAEQVRAAYNDWEEVSGRAEALGQIMADFIRQPPTASRLAPILNSVRNLVGLLENGPLAHRIDMSLLPADARAWTFVAVGEELAAADLFDDLRALGFTVDMASDIDAVVALLSSQPQTILLAGASWLTAQAGRIRPMLPKSAAMAFAAPLAVAVATNDDFLLEIRARQAGARLLLDVPLDVPRLLVELAGLAWMPRAPYRVLLVDDDRGVLEVHAGVLRTAGCEVLAVDDPVAAREYLEEFAPEACVLDVEMPACRGTDLAALLKRKARFARLPILYLSGFNDIEHQLDARHAGGEDFLTKPVDARLLATAAISRARRYRRSEAIERCVLQSRRELEDLRSALDVHAIVSVSAPDGTIIDANRYFCEVSGYDRTELIGRNHRIVRSGHHPPAFFEEMWRTIASGRVWQGEVQNRRKDGSAYWVQSTIVPILDEQQRPQRYISIRTDITEQKRVLEDRERQGRLLDLVLQALTHYISSHDIHTTSLLLLDGMRLLTDSPYGFIGEVLYKSDGTPYLRTHAITDLAWDDESRRLIEAAEARGMVFRKLDSLYGAVLKGGEAVIANAPPHDPRSSGLPAGHPQLEAFLGLPIHHGNTLVGMAGLANRHGGYDADMIAFLAPLMASYAAILEAARMRSVQQFVIDNLHQSLEAAEHISQAKTERVTAWANALRDPLNAFLGHAQLLLMSAQGNPESREHAEMIRQSGQRFTEMIDELLAGLAADEAAATTAPASPSAALPVVAAERSGKRRRILVAEDNPANQSILRLQLDALGFDADIAADGVLALEKWQAGGHDLLLADRNMPRMNGIELARSIRAAEQELGSYIPIISITALNEVGDLTICRTAGMDDVLPKPQAD
ncbi:response regulator [Candidatus Symbiobacter mobilis]|uniref:histidine kinase n=1 Tax=Candidatus Symbiobacter mobilis CR TaxID=946483 RepID=U5NE44_9BURK|nr:response regulator [Candidatus Symbiobacter mobilis]AGX88399.1 PAS/PAC domain protein [Candidatus Symbiobacter mobilis CR]